MVENAIVNCAAYCQGVRVANVEIDEISEILKQSDKFVWIGLHEPGTELLAKIQKQFGLHELAIEDTHRISLSDEISSLRFAMDPLLPIRMYASVVRALHTFYRKDLGLLFMPLWMPLLINIFR